MDKLMLFIDYQNAYRSAREVFYDGAAQWFWQGQFNPYLLGKHLVDGSKYPRELTGVRIYRGLPSSKHDPKGYGASMAQTASWNSLPGVVTVSRPLRYPADFPKSPPEEKGVDVALAVDFVMGAVKGWFDVGVIMSLDTDLRPAIESVTTELHGIRAEVTAWNRPDRHCRRLSIPGKKIWCHWLEHDVYDQVADPTDYTQRT